MISFKIKKNQKINEALHNVNCEQFWNIHF